MRVTNNLSPAKRVTAGFLDSFGFVEEAMLHAKCSAYAMQVSFNIAYRLVATSEVLHVHRLVPSLDPSPSHVLHLHLTE